MRRHASNLAVFAFAQGDFDPGCWDLGAIADRRIARPEVGGLLDAARAGGLGFEVAEVDAGTQRGERRLRSECLRPAPNRPWRACGGARRSAPATAPSSVSSSKPFAVGVEPAGGIDIGDSDVVGKRRAPGLGAEFADDAEGLVEGDEHARRSGEKALDQIRRHGRLRHAGPWARRVAAHRGAVGAGAAACRAAGSSNHSRTSASRPTPCM